LAGADTACAETMLRAAKPPVVPGTGGPQRSKQRLNAPVAYHRVVLTCGVCGQAANPGSIFCRHCGAELPRRPEPSPEDQTTVIPTVQPAADYPTVRQPLRYPQNPPEPMLPPADFIPAGEPPPPRNRPAILAALVAGVVVLVLVGFGAAVYLLSKDNSPNAAGVPASSATPSVTSSSNTPAPTSSASSAPAAPATTSAARRAQTAAMKQLGGLVANSTSARSGVQGALSDIGSCRNIANAVSTLNRAASIRQALSAQAQKIDVSSLAGGSQLVSAFQNSMAESSAADVAYAQWGSQVRSTCKKTARKTSALAAAQDHDGKATAAKSAFSAAWNPIAQSLGLPPVSAGQF
jgi:hypothetical protein